MRSLMASKITSPIPLTSFRSSICRKTPFCWRYCTIRSAVTFPIRGKVAIFSALAVLMFILPMLTVVRGVVVNLGGWVGGIGVAVLFGRGVARASREIRVAGTLGVSIKMSSGVLPHAHKMMSPNCIDLIRINWGIIDSLWLVQSIFKIIMKIVLIGANGQLGSDLRDALSQHQVWSSARVALSPKHTSENTVRMDVTDLVIVHECIRRISPDIIINTSAFHRVDDIERDASQALLVNGHVAHQIARLSRELNCAFLHVSTDYVYDGLKHAPYVETDLPNPLSAYGSSKLVGEHLIRAAWHKHFIVRTCGLYGFAGASGKGGNFVNTMLRLARENKAINVVADQICTPTFTKDLAQQIALLIESTQYGLYHATNDGGCSWYEFAGEIFRLASVSPQLSPITSAQFNAPATRPPYSVLENAHLKRIGLDRMRHWREALAEYVHHIVSRETSTTS